jgi:HEAT repeat protein
MDEKLFKINLKILESEDLWPYPGWKAAMEFFIKCTNEGEDISPAVSALKDAYLESHHIDIMALAADALAIHYLNTRDFDELTNLIRDKEFGNYLAEALCRCSKKGRITPDNVFVLVESLPFCSLAHYQIYDALIVFVGKDKERMSQVMALLSGKNWLKQYIPEFLKNSIIFEKELNAGIMAVGIPELALLLQEKDIKEKAMNAFLWLVEADLDLSEALPSLHKALEDREREISASAAYCISFHNLNCSTPDFEGVDKFLADKRITVRTGTLSALGAILCSRKKHVGHLVTRTAKIILDKKADLGNSAYLTLERALKSGLDIDPGIETIELLIEKVAPENNVKAYLISYLGNDKKRAEILLGAIEKSKKNAESETIAAHCKNIISGDHVKVCSICKFIPREYFTSYESDVPKGVQKLIPQNPIQVTGNRKCPECGNYYSVDYDEEWESPTDGMSCIITIEIKRLTPLDALRTLKDKDLEEIKSKYDELIHRAESAINHPESYLREDAAAALAKHYIDKGEWEKIRELLKHEDKYVRLTVMNILNKQETTLTGQFIPTFESLLQDENDEIKKIACTRLFRFYSEANDSDKLKELVEKGGKIVKSTAIQLLRNDANADLRPFMPFIRESLTHSDVNLQSQAWCSLVQAIQNGIEVSINLELITRLISDENEKIRESATCALKDVVNKVDIRKVMPTLTRLIQEKDMSGYYAMSALKNLAKIRDISGAFPILKEIVLDKNNGRRESAAYLLKDAIEGSGRNKIDFSSLIPIFTTLLFDENEMIKNCASDVFKLLIKKHRDLSPVIREIMRMLTAGRVSYIESYLAKDVSNYLIKKKDWENLDKLLKSNKDVSGAASGALAEWAMKKKDISPVIPSLVANLENKNSYAREGAAYALAKFGEVKEKNAGLVKEEVEKSGIKNEDVDKLLKNIGERKI